jgi:hypothetical protein
MALVRKLALVVVQRRFAKWSLIRPYRPCPACTGGIGVNLFGQGSAELCWGEHDSLCAGFDTEYCQHRAPVVADGFEAQTRPGGIVGLGAPRRRQLQDVASMGSVRRVGRCVRARSGAVRRAVRPAVVGHGGRRRGRPALVLAGTAYGFGPWCYERVASMILLFVRGWRRTRSEKSSQNL